MKSKTLWIIVLVVSNVLMFSALLYLVDRYDLASQMLRGSSVGAIALQDYDYRKNRSYVIRRGLFKIYQPQNVRVVMLGDSITAGADWNELLSRTDVVNRSIGGDVTEGYLNRMSDIYSIKPDVCVIMGGINDIRKGVPVGKILQHYIQIVNELKMEGIRPVIQTTLYISPAREDWKPTNSKVKELNEKLMAFAKEDEIEILDVNDCLSKNGHLNPVFTYDGLHLVGLGYKAWGDQLRPVLRRIAPIDGMRGK